MKMILLCLIALGSVIGLASCTPGPSQATSSDERPQAPRDPSQQARSIAMEKATFGAGCFWGVEETFRKIPGVVSTAVGYSGGTLQRPTYEDVCTDRTGHAEVVQVEFDPAQVSFESLLDVFWKNHDPTTPNQQGPDFGTQYRSVIFYHGPEQQAAAAASKEKLDKSGKHRRPIVTEIVPAATFWRAEAYHQRYLEKRGMTGCRTH